MLDVDNSNGPVTITGAAEREQITVTARISDGLRETEERQTLVDGVLELRASCPLIGSEWCSVRYTIEVPADIEVRADTDNGRLRVSGVDGPVHLDTDNGSVEVADVTGNLTIGSNNGSITASRLTSDTVVAETDNGSLTIELLETPTSVEARSDNGSVEVVLPRDGGRLPSRHLDGQRRRLRRHPHRSGQPAAHPHRHRQRRRHRPLRPLTIPFLHLPALL